jgi:hypothetical protein
MLIITTLFSWALFVHAQNAVTLPELVNPRYLVVDNHQVIISDYPHIYIYSLEDFNLKKKIGNEGQGPGEFYIPRDNMNLKERGLVISVCPDYIAASSVGRVSYFKRNGDFIRLTKTPSNINSKFILLGEKWLGFIPGSGKLSVFIYDSNLDKKVKILECDYWLRFGSKKMYNFFDRASDTLLTAVHQNRIFLTRGDSPDFAIDVFDFNGNKLDSIKHNKENIKIPKSFVSRIHKYFRVKFRNRSSDYFIKNLNLPDYFPAVRNFSTADNKLYVVTFKETAGKTEVLVFSAKGNFLRKILLPVKEKNPEHLFPFSFSKDKFYQLIENEETENWELFVTPFK